MKLEKKDIEEFIKNNKNLEIKFNYYEGKNEIEFNLCSIKVNTVVGITDSDDNYATDECLYVDYVYLDDGMKAWQVQINSKFLQDDGIEMIKELLPKFFENEKIILDNKLIKPLRAGCNFDKDNLV